MLYFISGSTPIRFAVKRRRIVYLHHILNQKEDYLIRLFFEKQMETRKTKDWSSQVLKDLKDLEINYSMKK